MIGNPRHLNIWNSFQLTLLNAELVSHPFRAEVLRAARNQTLYVVLSSFEAARDHVIALNGPDWSVVIVDEAHRLKCMTSLVTQALDSLDWTVAAGLDSRAPWYRWV